jgi:hypothetical protein
MHESPGTCLLEHTRGTRTTERPHPGEKDPKPNPKPREKERLDSRLVQLVVLSLHLERNKCSSILETSKIVCSCQKSVSLSPSYYTCARECNVVGVC